jgi:hypothetical protein
MLSQIGYLGCIVKPTVTQIKKFSELINSFIRGSLNIAKDRLNTATGEGG